MKRYKGARITRDSSQEIEGLLRKEKKSLGELGASTFLM